MNIKRTCVVVALILLLAGLAACTRSLTPSDKAAQTSPEDVVSEEVTPAAGTEVMGQLFLLATQTAMARQGISAEELPEGSTEEAPTEVAPDTTETDAVDIFKAGLKAVEPSSAIMRFCERQVDFLRSCN